MHVAVNGETDHLDSTESSVTEVEEEVVRTDPPSPLTATAPVLEPLSHTDTYLTLLNDICNWRSIMVKKLLIATLNNHLQKQKESSPVHQTQDVLR